MLLASSTVFLTVMFSLAFGIACGYLVIIAILRTFGHKPQSAQTAAATAAIATSASGH